MKPLAKPLSKSGLVLLVLATAGVAAADALAERYEKHFTAHAPAFVTLRMTGVAHVAMGGQSGDIEGESELLGVVVDPTGIVLVSNSVTGGPTSAIVRRLKEAMPGLTIDMEIRRLVVVLPDESTEREARVVARDGPLDLAWVQVLDAKEKPLPSVDLSTEGSVAVGAPLFTISRLERSFDFAPVLGKLSVSGQYLKPRTLWAVSGAIRQPGALAFDLSGKPVGAFSYQEPVGDEEQSGPRLAIVPLGAVKKSLEAARPLAAKALAEAAEARASEAAPAEKHEKPEKPDAPK